LPKLCGCLFICISIYCPNNLIVKITSSILIYKYYCKIQWFVWHQFFIKIVIYHVFNIITVPKKRLPMSQKNGHNSSENQYFWTVQISKEPRFWFLNRSKVLIFNRARSLFYGDFFLGTPGISALYHLTTKHTRAAAICRHVTQILSNIRYSISTHLLIVSIHWEKSWENFMKILYVSQCIYYVSITESQPYPEVRIILNTWYCCNFVPVKPRIPTHHNESRQVVLKKHLWLGFCNWK